MQQPTYVDVVCPALLHREHLKSSSINKTPENSFGRAVDIRRDTTSYLPITSSLCSDHLSICSLWSPYALDRTQQASETLQPAVLGGEPGQVHAPPALRLPRLAFQPALQLRLQGEPLPVPTPPPPRPYRLLPHHLLAVSPLLRVAARWRAPRRHLRDRLHAHGPDLGGSSGHPGHSLLPVLPTEHLDLEGSEELQVSSGQC